ncbi:MAG TPA: hypothetical protein VHG09_15005 [Longimicrobiales bacterium]|nr:hypothetical protein [Longimicrobiales bacterium]
MLHTLLLTFPVMLCPSCSTEGAAEHRGSPSIEMCHTVQAPRQLPDDVRETSGLAMSGREPQVLWTHNDRGNDAVIYAIDAAGTLRAHVTVTGAQPIDWEDIEAAPCASGTCLYIADIGDNDGERESITIHEVPEPELRDGASASARALHARYPDGPHNAESLFVLPGGDMYIVTKGDDGPVSLYRYPAARRGDEDVVLELVRQAIAQPRERTDLVTGAAASPDGRHIALRTYGSLFIYTTESLLRGSDTTTAPIDLRSLGEPQGEGVAVNADGTVWLSSEAENSDARPLLSRLSCPLPE